MPVVQKARRAVRRHRALLLPDGADRGRSRRSPRRSRCRSARRRCELGAAQVFMAVHTPVAQSALVRALHAVVRRRRRPCRRPRCTAMPGGVGREHRHPGGARAAGCTGWAAVARRCRSPARWCRRCPSQTTPFSQSPAVCVDVARAGRREGGFPEPQAPVQVGASQSVGVPGQSAAVVQPPLLLELALVLLVVELALVLLVVELALVVELLVVGASRCSPVLLAVLLAVVVLVVVLLLDAGAPPGAARAARAAAAGGGRGPRCETSSSSWRSRRCWPWRWSCRPRRCAAARAAAGAAGAGHASGAPAARGRGGTARAAAAACGRGRRRRPARRGGGRAPGAHQVVPVHRARGDGRDREHGRGKPRRRHHRKRIRADRGCRSAPAPADRALTPQAHRSTEDLAVGEEMP